MKSLSRVLVIVSAALMSCTAFADINPAFADQVKIVSIDTHHEVQAIGMTATKDFDALTLAAVEVGAGDAIDMAIDTGQLVLAGIDYGEPTYCGDNQHLECRTTVMGEGVDNAAWVPC